MQQFVHAAIEQAKQGDPVQRVFNRIINKFIDDRHYGSHEFIHE